MIYLHILLRAHFTRRSIHSVPAKMFACSSLPPFPPAGFDQFLLNMVWLDRSGPVLCYASPQTKS